jgi:hypothetical protein
MDFWHTCEPDKLGTEGWLGRVVREMDPKKENVVTAVNALFREAFPSGPLSRGHVHYGAATAAVR